MVSMSLSLMILNLIYLIIKVKYWGYKIKNRFIKDTKKIIYLMESVLSLLEKKTGNWYLEFSKMIKFYNL